MKKLNNKGMTLVELLVCFSICSAIVISMFHSIMSYQTEERTESIRSDVVAYKDTLTKLIQTDIINGELKSVRVDVFKEDVDTRYQFILKFNRSVGTIDSKPIYYKKLIVYLSDKKENYISYEDVNQLGNLQTAKYILPEVLKCSGSNCSDPARDLKFSAVSTNISIEQTNLITNPDGTVSSSNPPLNLDGTFGDNYGINVFLLDITISHSELGGDYHIHIVAPLDYTYCKYENE